MFLKEIYNKTGKLPTSDLKEVAGIVTAIYRKEWAESNIDLCNDLLKSVFGEINLYYGKYKREQTFNEIIDLIKEFKLKNNREPLATDKNMQKIARAVYRKIFIMYGVNSWKELLMFANNHPN